VVIVNGGTLALHAAWTFNLFPGRANEIETQAMLYGIGTHLEEKKLEDNLAPKTDGAGLIPAKTNIDLAIQVRLLY
jgi:hypothetical protein